MGGEKAGKSWASANLLNPSQLAAFSRSKQQLLRDMRRSGIIFEGFQQQSPDDDQEADLPEVGGDTSSGILDSWEEMEAFLDTSENSVEELIDQNSIDDTIAMMFLKAV